MALTQACIDEIKLNPKEYRAIFDKHNNMQDKYNRFTGEDLLNAQRLSNNWEKEVETYEEYWARIYASDMLIMR
jgi:hypothetical protein